MPDHEALLAAIPAMSLMESRRYLLADGVERWRDKQLEPVLAALGELPPDLTVVLICPRQAAGEADQGGEGGGRRDPRIRGAEGARHAPPPRRRCAAHGLRASSPPRRGCWSIGWAPTRCGCTTSSSGSPSGPGRGAASASTTSKRWSTDTSEAAVWSLSDALLEGDAAAALRIGERLIGQGENVTGLIYGLASRLRSACAAAAQLEEGIPAQAGRVLAEDAPLRRQAAGRPTAGGRPRQTCGTATETLADLELWCRGGADYGDELALTLALRRAAAGAA